LPTGLTNRAAPSPCDGVGIVGFVPKAEFVKFRSRKIAVNLDIDSVSRLIRDQVVKHPGNLAAVILQDSLFHLMRIAVLPSDRTPRNNSKILDSLKMERVGHRQRKLTVLP
jgi:hypothetical protein